ncbi:hypothetical protein LOK49_LG05G01854 [Camellia lanceoleosa]|uniref:Uncharacterized protein n=1 Tax=Camellia lanceoleosa TaxID=1840588 RepID=A0ACC0HM09_9ERIC|nr:hypothetical protein LOK49_LG05G01854 [Camellia lanceoleosa]
MQLFWHVALIALPISPLILDTSPLAKGKCGLERFEAAWLLDRTTSEIVSKVWNVPVRGSFAFQTMQHQKFVIRHLRNWNNFPQRSLATEIAGVTFQLSEIQNRQDLLTSNGEEQKLRYSLDELTKKQKMFVIDGAWNQLTVKARAAWVGMDQQGNQLTWKKFSFVASSTLMAEARACFEVVNWCALNSVKAIIILMDSLQLVQHKTECM